MTLQFPSTLGRDYFSTLPYEAPRVDSVCRHSFLYTLQNYEEQPPFCGLCFFKLGWETEIPGRIHLFKTLADNGNPETSPKFMAHIFLVMGLKPPEPTENLREFRRKRKSPRAREQYTQVAPSLFPISSALWKLMGYQPPLGVVLVRAVEGRSEPEIAHELDSSIVSVHIRMAKAVRTAMRYIPDDRATEGSPDSETGGNDSGSSETNRRN